jgi:hypothetical protein
MSVDVVDGHAEPIRKLACAYKLERRRACAIQQFDRAARNGLYVFRAQEHRRIDPPHCRLPRRQDY